MRALVWVCVFSGTLLASNTQAFGQNRFGIVPLHSTRTDVERLYGVSSDSCRCNFRTSKETINVAFATAPCALPVYGWNVPRDTVLSFRVTSHVPQPLSEIAVDLNGFVQRYSPEDIRTTYYTNVDKGIVFAVQDRRVISVRYFPPSKENEKRCAGFPAWDGVPPPTPFMNIINRRGNEVYALLDNFGVELSANTKTRGYIITYAGKKSQRGEGKKMADEVRRYLVDKLMISSDRVIAFDGGFRETAQYDLFLFYPQVPPPIPTPTVPSNEVQIVKPGTRVGRRQRQTELN